MTKVLVLYYSSYGHIEKMAEAVAEGVREAGAEAVIKRAPETVPDRRCAAIGLQARPEGADCQRCRVRGTTMPSSSERRRASATWRRK